ncbi:MAG: hypothetical protein Q4E12_04890 [Coriobacteriia bacterium]|nr:hypothetical protein [Coriobacteriia bacterium]
MLYNIDFSVASLAVLALCLMHFYSHPTRKEEPTSAMFLIITWLALADVAFDVITSFTISYAASLPLFFLNLTSVVFYLLQLAMPLVLFCYVLALCNAFTFPPPPRFWALAVLPVLMALVTLSSPITHLVFWFDETTFAFNHGFMFPGLYVSCFFFVAATLVYAFLHADYLRPVDMGAVIVYVALSILAPAIQIAYPTLVLTSFAVGLCVMFLYLSLADPRGSVDTDTHLYNASSLKRQITAMRKANLPYSLACFSLDHLQPFNPRALAESDKSATLDFAAKIRQTARSPLVYFFGKE